MEADMFFSRKKVHSIRIISILAASLALVCLLLAACSGKEPEARRGLTPFPVDQNMTIYLPDGWQAQDTGEYGAAVDALASEMPIKLPMGTAMFFATRNNGQGNPAAFIGIAHTPIPGMSNDVLRGLTPEEKQQLAQAMVMLMRGLSSHINMPLAVDTAEFKSVGHYEPLVFSGQNEQTAARVPGWEANLLRFRMAFFFLPKDAVVLSYVGLPQNNAGIDAEFTRILGAFEPDAGYKPAPPPARREGESMEVYMMRAGAMGGAQ